MVTMAVYSTGAKGELVKGYEKILIYFCENTYLEITQQKSNSSKKSGKEKR